MNKTILKIVQKEIQTLNLLQIHAIYHIQICTDLIQHSGKIIPFWGSVFFFDMMMVSPHQRKKDERRPFLSHTQKIFLLAVFLKEKLFRKFRTPTEIKQHKNTNKKLN